MFKSGTSKINCFCFCVTNPTAHALDPDGNSAGVDDNFFNLCGVSDWSGLTCDDLKVHPQQLEAIQHAPALMQLLVGKRNTPSSFLSIFGSQLRRHWEETGSVAGMEPVKVSVEVSTPILRPRTSQL